MTTGPIVGLGIAASPAHAQQAPPTDAGFSSWTLGFLSLTENLMMIAVAVWMSVGTLGHVA